jgi:glycosyltransferase involved in cell wall biosynthesis
MQIFQTCKQKKMEINHHQDYQNRRIAVFFTSLDVGGTPRAMLRLMEGFVKAGFTVDAVVVRAFGSFLDKIPEGVNLVDLGAGRTLTSIPSFIQYLRKNKPDVVLSALMHVNLAAIIARMLSGTSPRLVISERSNLTEKKIHAIHIWDKISIPLINIFYPLADAIITVSLDASKDLIESTKLDPEKVITIYNPIPVDEIQRASTEKNEHPWFSNHEIPVILAVGRLSPPKDYPTLINTFNILHERKRVRLIIVGEGEERQRIERVVKSSPFSEDILLFGRSENPFPYMAKANVFVLSSAWEGFPNVLVEALACGATVVSTNCHSGPSEILQDGKYGRMVPVGDAQALAKAIELSLDHPFPAEQGISRARDFSVEKAIRKYLGVLFPDIGNIEGNHKI